jgi:hypothetical protein
MSPVTSVGSGQAEHVFSQVVEDHLLRDGGDSHQPGLLPIPGDVVLVGIAESAMSLHSLIRSGERSIGG